MRSLILGLLLIYITACSSNERTYYSNGQVKTEIKRLEGNKGLLTEFNETGDRRAEFELTDTIKNGTAKYYLNDKLTFVTKWINGDQSLKIEDLSGNADLGLINTFPDTLNIGDTLLATYFLNNKAWRIKKAYLSCNLDEDGILKQHHRFDNECLELPVYGDTLYIRFATMGKGDKVFAEPITLIAENEIKILQAILIDNQKYFLK